MTIDFDEIKNNTGLEFQNVEQLYFYAVRLLENLKVNNKNYTKKQYFWIDELFSFIKAVKL